MSDPLTEIVDIYKMNIRALKSKTRIAVHIITDITSHSLIRKYQYNYNLYTNEPTHSSGIKVSSDQIIAKFKIILK